MRKVGGVSRMLGGLVWGGGGAERERDREFVLNIIMFYYYNIMLL
jgi:hypothetical protein